MVKSKPDIHISYKIDGSKDEFEPNDEVSGVFWIKNEGKKDRKLKKVEFQIIETYYKFIYDSFHHRERWILRKNILKRYPFDGVDKGSTLKSAEIKEYEFNIILPSK